MEIGVSSTYDSHLAFMTLAAEESKGAQDKA